MDEELAELTADQEEPKGPPTLRPSQNTVEVQLLVRIVALLQQANQQKQEKRIPFPPLPRMRTARDAVRERVRSERRQRLWDRVTEAQARWTAENGPAPQQRPESGP